jgi:hypothetical protein
MTFGKAKQISCNAHAQTKMVLADRQAFLRISLRSVNGASHWRMVDKIYLLEIVIANYYLDGLP